MEAKINKHLLATLKPQKAAYEVHDTDMPEFVLRVMPSGVMSFSIRYRSGGTRRRLTIGDAAILTPLQARDEARRLLADITRGTDPAEAKRLAAATLGDFIEKHYAVIWLKGKRSGDQTLARLKRCFEKEFWNRQMDDPKLGFEVIDWRARRKAATSTLNRDIAALKSVFSRALEWQLIKQNPLASVKPLDEDHTPIVRYLDANEEQRLMQALDARDERVRAERDRYNLWRRERALPELPNLRTVPYPDHLRPMLIMLLNTGLRKGELLNLSWSDVDLDRSMIVIRAETSKSKKVRHVPLNSTVRETLQNWQKSNPAPSTFVFPGRRGGRMDNFNNSWRALRDQAGLENFRLHDCRHHFASRLVMAGVPLNTVRQLLGHGDLKTTLRYAHLSPEVQQDAVELLVSRNNIISFAGPSRKATGARGSKR